MIMIMTSQPGLIAAVAAVIIVLLIIIVLVIIMLLVKKRYYYQNMDNSKVITYSHNTLLPDIGKSTDYICNCTLTLGSVIGTPAMA